MPRISKKKNIAAKRIYSVGIYARLSVDGEKAGGQRAYSQARKNESIETQIEIAKAFVRQQKDMVIFDCYTDIGKTGTNFHREGFERMMRDVRMRRIDCIIVKDLSRFGRNHIETGNYIERIFPFLGVRFIAVTDNFDSMNVSGQSEALGVNLKNLVNEMYARDIAVKVKASRKEKWSQGSYTGGVPPYGYRAAWIGDKKCLYIEETTSDIVKKIYDLFLSGKNMKEIVEWLYGKGIVRPALYHKTGRVYCQEGSELLQWSKATVKMILTNPVYMGYLVQGRTCGKDYRICDFRDMDSEKWSVKEHTHEAIVSKDIFFQAASRFEKSSVYCNKSSFSKSVPVEADIFDGILYCGDCGTKMRRVTQVKAFHSKERIRIYSYNCPKADRIDEHRCVTKSITLSTLTELVRKAIRQEFALSAMHLKDFVQISAREAETEKKEWNAQLIGLDRKIAELTKRGSEQYIQYRMGEMSEISFRKVRDDNSRRMAAFQIQQADIAEKLKEIDAYTAWKNQCLRALAQGSAGTELTAEAVGTLLHRIEIYQDQRVKIIFAFKRRNMPEAQHGG